jgi:hypothetical protein
VTGPAWLGSVLGVIVLLAGFAALARLVVAWRLHRPTDAQVDVHNVLMGLSMAGLLIPQLLIASGRIATSLWLAVWIVVTLWFVLSVVRDTVRGGPGRTFAGHHVPHLVMSAAMVLMFAPVASASFTALSYAFVVFMVGYVVLVVDRLPVIAIAGVGEARVIGHRPASGSAMSVRPIAPRISAATNVVLALAMGYMLVLLLG